MFDFIPLLSYTNMTYSLIYWHTSSIFDGTYAVLPSAPQTRAEGMWERGSGHERQEALWSWSDLISLSAEPQWQLVLGAIPFQALPSKRQIIGIILIVNDSASIT